MKAEKIHEHPTFELMKQNDVVSVHHLQFPGWLLEEERYAGLNTVSMLVYMLLFNRFRLSKYKGWTNEDGEVFVIYTRKEMAKALHVGERLITDAMNDLKDLQLIWERRCGRGFANQIYISRVTLSETDAAKSEGGPFDLPPPDTDGHGDWPDDGDIDDSPQADEKTKNNSRPAKTTGLVLCENERHESTCSEKDDKSNVFNVSLLDKESEQPIKTRQNGGSVIIEKAIQNPVNGRFLNGQNSDSRPVVTTAQEPSIPRPSNNDFRTNDLSASKSSQSESSQRSFARANMPYPVQDGRTDIHTDAEKIDDIFDFADLDFLEDNEAKVIKDAIIRLYFSESIKVGGAIYPNSHIRSYLNRLDWEIVQSTLQRLARNEEKIRNSSAYVTTVLFNTIMENEMDLIVDPYLNSLRRSPGKRTALTAVGTTG